MMLGVDAAGLNVIADTDTAVEPAMLEWAPRWRRAAGSRWTTTARASRCNTWRSRRKQLHLFAALDGTCYLLQLQRMAAYLQAGLLAVHDEEALTVRATRDALQKIQANPERLAPPEALRAFPPRRLSTRCAGDDASAGAPPRGGSCSAYRLGRASFEISLGRRWNRPPGRRATRPSSSSSSRWPAGAASSPCDP
jgi:hypothetical protein